MLDELFDTENECSAFDYGKCHPQIMPCADPHHGYRYSDSSASWVLVSAIIVFFMKAGFLLIELAFAEKVRDKRHVVVVKHLDVFASCFGFFLLGFDYVSNYTPPHDDVERKFFSITDPILWFFKFTFASNAATILGGCLVTNMYKIRLPAAFLSSFVISGVIHPLIARLIWGDKQSAYFSPYRFCINGTNITSIGCDSPFKDRMYVLDFAGGGAVHLVGGVAGLVLCLFAKLHKYREEKILQRHEEQRSLERNSDSELDRSALPRLRVQREVPETVLKRNFWEWMYPVDGGGEATTEAALGVLILWFCWFAFNCGSTESLETATSYINSSNEYRSFHDVPSTIAINMILAASSGGILAVLIASWAQIRSQSESMNANEIANGVLSALVAITSSCPFVDYWAACIIGVLAVVVYHLGCWAEYKLKIEDTARVVPVHGLCGLWSLIAVGLFIVDDAAECNLHATFEGLCYCALRLPKFNFGERLAAQLIGAALMVAITVILSGILYGALYLLPMKTNLKSDSKVAIKYNYFVQRVFKFIFNQKSILLEGNWLFSGPAEIPRPETRHLHDFESTTERPSLSISPDIDRPEFMQHHRTNYRLLTHSQVSDVSESYGATAESLSRIRTTTTENSMYNGSKRVSDRHQLL